MNPKRFGTSGLYCVSRYNVILIIVLRRGSVASTFSYIFRSGTLVYLKLCLFIFIIFNLLIFMSLLLVISLLVACSKIASNGVHTFPCALSDVMILREFYLSYDRTRVVKQMITPLSLNALFASGSKVE